MKTFKLCSLIVLADHETEPSEIPLTDGLIINKEEVQKNWLLEFMITEEWQQYFSELHNTQEKFMVETTITKKTNDPATFVCTVKSINELKSGDITILLDGFLVVKEDDFSDMVLKSIINEGFEGEEIIREFKRRKKDRGRAIRGALNNAFVQVKGKFFE